MGKFKGIISVALALMVIMGTPILSFAGNNSSESETIEYEETHDQIVFDDLSVLVINEDEVVVEVDPTISIFKKGNAKQQKEKYDLYIKEHTDATSALFEKFQSGENVCVLSYTETPVVAKEDHYERIPKTSSTVISPLSVTANAAVVSKGGDPTYEADGNFMLSTLVTRKGESNPYLYTAMTIGIWENKTSPLGGSEDKPSDGDDFVVQSCPTVTLNSKFACGYNYKTKGSTEGQEGTHYKMKDVSDSVVKYSVVDDPLGLAQLNNFCLTQTYRAKSTTSAKKVISAYVHTWKKLDLNIELSGSAGKEGDESTKEVSVKIAPTIENCSWTLKNFVTYEF